MRAGCGMGGGNAVLSDVGRDRTPGIQSLAKRRSGYTGHKASVGPAGRPASIPRESGPPRPPGGVVFCRIIPPPWSYAEPYNHWLGPLGEPLYANV